MYGMQGLDEKEKRGRRWYLSQLDTENLGLQQAGGRGYGGHEAGHAGRRQDCVGTEAILEQKCPRCTELRDLVPWWQPPMEIGKCAFYAGTSNLYLTSPSQQVSEGITVKNLPVLSEETETQRG